MLTEIKPISSWAADDRPREKLMHKGRMAMSDAELIAILLRTGTREDTAIDLARKIMVLSGNNLEALGRINLQALTGIKGIGKTKAITLLAALELGRRRSFTSPVEKNKITTSLEAFQIFCPLLCDQPHELFFCLPLDRANQPMEPYQVSSGGISETLVDPRMVFNRALQAGASGIIVAHNHPSGNLNPSEADLNLTRRLIECGKILNIRILDHLIIGHSRYLSFSDEEVLVF